MKILNRTDYLNVLQETLNTPEIKIVTGIRRSGKSQLLKSFIEEIQKTDDDANIIYADLSLLENESLLEYHTLHSWAKQACQPGKHNYLILDEVQLCPHFELAINSLHASGLFRLYLTGSNAFLLSSDLATLFTGRHIEIHVMPFSFSEYCSYFDSAGDIQEALDSYVRQGGLSGSYLYDNVKGRQGYIKNVYQTILRRDLVEKYNLNDAQALEHVAEFIMDNVGNITSPNNVSKGLTAAKMPTSHITVGSYLKYLCDAYVLYRVRRYDIRGQKYLQTSDKYYLADSGIRYAVLGRRNMDYGRMYENIVALELIRRGYDIWVGKLYEKEVDFVALRGSEKIYIQVSDDISNHDTFQREAAPLLQIRDAYPKLIIARTRHAQQDYYGIRIIDLAEWLSKTAV